MVNTLTNNKIDICRSDLLICCLGEILGKKYLKSGEKHHFLFFINSYKIFINQGFPILYIHIESSPPEGAERLHFLFILKGFRLNKQ